MITNHPKFKFLLKDLLQQYKKSYIPSQNTLVPVTLCVQCICSTLNRPPKGHHSSKNIRAWILLRGRENSNRFKILYFTSVIMLI